MARKLVCLLTDRFYPEVINRQIADGFHNWPMAVVPIINTKDVDTADILIIGAPYDRTASFRKGAAKGPDAIVDCLENQIERYERFTGSVPVADCAIAYHCLSDLNRLMPEKMVARVASEYRKCLDRDQFIVLLGGEHSVSTGALQALASLRDPWSITVCQIDAHLDLRHDDSDYRNVPHGTCAHCTVMRRAVELGFKTVQVGVRAYSREEISFAREHRLPFYEWTGDPAPDPAAIIESIATDLVYLSIDVDGFDPAVMPATGTPVPGGLEWFYGIGLIREIFKRKTVIAADIVEVAPRPFDVITEYGAAQLCYSMIAFWEYYRRAAPEKMVASAPVWDEDGGDRCDF